MRSYSLFFGDDKCDLIHFLSELINVILFTFYRR